MNKKAETIALAALLVAAYCNSAWGQTPPSAILEIDIENVVEYITDITDLTQYGTKPNITPSNPTATSPRNLGTASGIGDIVAINGQPAKGALTFRVWAFQLSPAPSIPGAFPRAIADTQRASMRSLTLEILKSDGTQVGTIMTLGMGGGGAAGVPPGAPLGLTSMNFAIAGGNGAFLGARGQLGQASTSQTVGARTASIAEDPAYRRVNGGGRLRYVLHVIPMSTPQIVITGDGPAVYHTDFSPVTAAQPAKAGEVLIVKATGDPPFLE